MFPLISKVLLTSTVGTVFLLLVILYYGKKIGQNDTLANTCLIIPIVFSLMCSVCVFWLPHFWLYWLGLMVCVFGINLLAFTVMSSVITDRSGLGITMFSGMVSFYAMGTAVLVKIAMYVYHFIF